MLTPALRHRALVLVLTDGIRRVKGEATEQVNGAAVMGQGRQGKKKRGSMSHQARKGNGAKN